MKVVSGQWSVVSGLRRHGRLNAVPSPLARSGVSLLEIIISIFILSIGVLGVASLIPLGKLALVETNKSDRSGACGRAGLREIKTRRMTDTSTMGDPAVPLSPPNMRSGLNVLGGPFVVDPLGVSSSYSLTMNLGGTRVAGGPLFPLPRLTFGGIMPLAADTAAQKLQKQTLTDLVFRWQDDLTFDRVSGSSARPRGFARDSTGRVGPYPPLPSEPAFASPTPISPTDGLFSWFFTVMPDQQRPGTYYVSVVVCYRRNFRQDTSVAPAQPEGEQAVDLMLSTVKPAYPGGALAFPGSGFGGGTVALPTPPTDTNLSHPINKLKDNQWVMLCGWTLDGSNNRIPCCCQWYRVVGVNRADAKPDSPVSMVSLTGPDWTPADTNCPANPDHASLSPKIGTSLVVVDGVIGVYSSTVQLDNDTTWNR